MNDPLAGKGPRGDGASHEPVEAPPPLIDEAHPTDAGRLLRAAVKAYRSDLDEDRAWRRLTERHQRGWQWRLGTAAAALAAAAAIGFVLRPSTDVDLERETTPIVTAERTLAQPTSRAAAASEAPALEPVPALESEPPKPVAPPSVAARKNAPAPEESECRGLAASGKVERAVDCFRTLSQAAGLSAEVALYEVARLELEVRRNPSAALRALEEHRQRFASGALRGEVDHAMVRALADLGRADRALAESEALLARPWGRSIASQLHLLRGRLFEHELHDCARAVPEYVALVGEAGDAGDEAELGRARCLTALGRRGDAAAAYRQYLSRSDPRKASLARQKLLELGGTP